MWYSQSERILKLLKRKKRVKLTDLMDLRIASYRKRISELRDKGHLINNFKEYDAKNKCWKSYYVYCGIA